LKLAVFGDIHGNLAALEAVLADAGRRGADAVVHLGDLPGPGGRCAQIVRRLASEGIPGVRGEADELAAARGPQAGPTGVSEEDAAFLNSLPAQFWIEEGGLRFLFAHANPWPSQLDIASEGTLRRSEEQLREGGVDVLVIGHTHRFALHQFDGRAILNPGSAGLPEDGSNRAPYLLLDTAEGLRVSRACAEFHVENHSRDGVASRVLIGRGGRPC